MEMHRKDVTYSYYGCLALALFIESVLGRSSSPGCPPDSNDVASKAAAASIVLEGRADSRIPVPGRSDVYRVRFKVLKTLKGSSGTNLATRNHSKSQLLTRHSSVIVGDFGYEDRDNCVAPEEIRLRTHYILFIRRPDRKSSSTSGPNKTTDWTMPNVVVVDQDGSPMSTVYPMSSFPELVSEKALRAVRNLGEAGRSARRPKITKVSKDKTEVAGKRLRLHCRSTGRPSPRITWFKDGVALKRDGRTSMKENEKRPDSRLEMRNVDVSDAGLYQCRATNVLGDVASSRDIRVVVNTKQHQPQKAYSDLCPEQSYCLNGGTCFVMTLLSNASYCECARNYVGLRCEEKVLGRNAQSVVGKGIYYV